MVYEMIGWVGAILFILSYFLLSLGYWNANQIRYHVMNLFGAVFLVVNGIHYRDSANILVNVVWASIASVAIYRAWNSLVRNKA